MAEIGSLEVSLSLNAENFNNTVSQANRHIKSMGSELQAVKGKGLDYEKSINGLTQKKGILTRAVEASSLKLQEERRRYDELTTSGKATEAQIERQANAVNKAQAEYNRLSTQLSAVDKELKIQSSSWTQIGAKLDPLGSKLTSVGNAMTSVGKSLSMKVTAPLVALGAGAFKTAVDFESAMAGVRKTTDLTEAEFKTLEQGIRDMAKELPSAATDIAGVAEQAGQLGISKENILAFSRTIIDLGESTNLSLDQAGTEFARFANIVGMPQENFDRLGSSVVALGNNMETTESEIVAMGMRLAAQGRQVGMSEAQIMALGASMSSLGIEAEAGGTAMTTVLKKMQTAVMDNGKELDKWAAIAGVSAADFKEAYEQDAVQALDLLIKGLGEGADAGGNMSKMLADLGIKGIREADTMMRLAGASDILAGAVDTSTRAWEENTALTDEAAQRYETLKAQIKIMVNQIKDIGMTLGEVLIPIARDALSSIKPLIENFADMNKKTQTTIVAIGALAAAAGPLLVIGGSLMSGIGGLVTAVGTLSTAIGAAGGASAAFGGVLSVLTGPVGIAVGTIAGLTAGGIALYRHLNQDVIPEVDRFGEGVSENTQKAVGAFMDMSEKADAALKAASWSGKMISFVFGKNKKDPFWEGVLI